MRPRSWTDRCVRAFGCTSRRWSSVVAIQRGAPATVRAPGGGTDRLQQVVDRMQLEGLAGVGIVGRGENDGRRGRQLLQVGGARGRPCRACGCRAAPRRPAAAAPGSSASRPLSASPTMSTGSWPAQSASRSRMRRRAGASSSTMSTRRGGLGAFMGVRHDDVHLVSGDQRFQLELGVDVEMQLQPLADVGQRHLVARDGGRLRRRSGCAARCAPRRALRRC